MAAVCLLAVTACTSTATSKAPATSLGTDPSRMTTSHTSPTPSHRTPATTHRKTTSATHRTTTHPPITSTQRSASSGAPVIVIDPGHSPLIESVDPATGLNDSTYENEPEMRDVFAVSLLLKQLLTANGYRVIMTKNSVDDRISLGQRAAIANNAHAALGLSIHDQAGPNGGIPFNAGNNIVYYQSVGGYRMTPAGRRITFTDGPVAAASQRCGEIFQAQRAAAEGHSVELRGDVGYDLGSRDLPAGDMWMVQLLSKVPWIYNEAGGNSVGMSGLNGSDEHKYADGLAAAVERCVPIGR